MKNPMQKMARVLSAVMLMIALLGSSRPSQAQSNDVYLTGPASWRVTGNRVRIAVQSVANDSYDFSTGTLKLALLATASPYRGGYLSGHTMAEVPLGELEPEEYFEDIDETVSFSSPPRGTYYSVLALLEYDGSGYVVDDFFTFSNTFTVGAPTTNPGPALLRFGTWGFQWNGNVATMTVNNVVNNSNTQSSGPLTLEVWAFPSRYDGRPQRGFRMGQFSVAGLRPRTSYSRLSRNVPFTRPPSGVYYGTLILREGSVIRYFSNTNSPFSIR